MLLKVELASILPGAYPTNVHPLTKVLAGIFTALKYVLLVPYGFQYCVTVLYVAVPVVGLLWVGAIPPLNLSVLLPIAYNVTLDVALNVNDCLSVYDLEVPLFVVAHP